MKSLHRFAAAALTALLTTLVLGCAQLGMQTPDTFNKRVVTANTAVQVVAESATAGLASGVLKPSDATNVVTTARISLQAIMVAQELFATACPLRAHVETPEPTCTSPAADAKLKATLAILTALQAYLATQGAK